MRYLLLCILALTASASFAEHSFLFQVHVKTPEERTHLAEEGFALDHVLSDSVYFTGTSYELEKLQTLRFRFEATPLPKTRTFPTSDAAFHDYKETIDALDSLAKRYPGIARRFSIGKSLEGRELAGIRLSTDPFFDDLPTAVFLGCHHAREHLSVEVPLKLAEYLAENYKKDPRIQNLLDTREVWIVPMVNPDGAEYDISGGRYRSWRKNIRSSSGRLVGVDLNRNYGKDFGGPGSSSDPRSETYRGPSAFSEPETQAVRDFLRARLRATTLLTYHTYGELVMWPWGSTNARIAIEKDRTVFEKMGKQMAKWNGYTAQKSSALYLASGDTTDWAYDELKIFAFTFELSPVSSAGGGFYPGARAIEPTFKANVEPALYLIENTENPYKVLDAPLNPLHIR